MAFAVAARAHPVLEARMVREVRGVAAVRQFEHDDAGRLGRQLLEDHRDRRRRRLVAGQQQLVGAGRGHEVDAVAHARVSRGRREDEHLVADGRLRDPRGCRAQHVVRDHVDVHFVHVVANLARRVRPERRALILGHLAPPRVPVVAGGHRVEADRLGREDDLHPLVEPGIAVFGEVGRRRT